MTSTTTGPRLCHTTWKPAPLSDIGKTEKRRYTFNGTSDDSFGPRLPYSEPTQQQAGVYGSVNGPGTDDNEGNNIQPIDQTPVQPDAEQ